MKQMKSFTSQCAGGSSKIIVGGGTVVTPQQQIAILNHIAQNAVLSGINESKGIQTSLQRIISDLESKKSMR